jgi:thiamine pyrophosphate-dependent acetolactate synthase large subunit-like protein
MIHQPAQPPLDRRAVVRRLLGQRDGNQLVIAGLGSAAYDLMDAGDDPANFYLWGAMGAASLMGLGLALAQPARRVVVVTGDGEQLMGIGGLASIGVQRPPNLTIVVLDNGHYGETGMQRSHTGHGTDLVLIATGCGFDWSLDVGDDKALDGAIGRLQQRSGCGFVRIAVAAVNLPRVLPPRDGVHVKNRFRQHLGLGVS